MRILSAILVIAFFKFFLIFCHLRLSLILAGSPTCSALLPYGDEKNFGEDDEEDEDDEDDEDDEENEEDIMIKILI